MFKKIFTATILTGLLTACGPGGLYRVEEQRGDSWHVVGEANLSYIDISGKPQQWFVDQKHQVHLRLTNGTFYTPVGNWRVVKVQ